MYIVNKRTGKKVFAAGHDIDACLVCAWVDHHEFIDSARTNNDKLIYERTVKKVSPVKSALMSFALVALVSIATTSNVFASNEMPHVDWGSEKVIDVSDHPVNLVEIDNYGRNDVIQNLKQKAFDEMKDDYNWEIYDYAVTDVIYDAGVACIVFSAYLKSDSSIIERTNLYCDRSGCYKHMID